MKPLDYQTSSTPPPRFQRFNRLEQSLGTAGLLSLACAAAALLPFLAAAFLYALYRLSPGLTYLSLLLNLTLAVTLLALAFFYRQK